MGGPPFGGGPPPYGGGPPGFGPPQGGGFGPPPPPRSGGTSATAIILIVVGVMAVLGLGTCGMCVGLGALGSSKTKTATNVYVWCEGAPQTGYNCTVTHTAGTQGATACWDIHVNCANGVVSNGHACQYVPVGGKASRYVTSAEMSRAFSCDRGIGTSVQNVVVK
jgi:hypothetical protein